MWFADLNKNNVYLYVDNEKYTFNITECCGLYKRDKKIFFLCKDRVLIYYKNALVNSFSVADKDSNCLLVSDKIYVSGEDTGTVSIFDFYGNLISIYKLGEHIADFKSYNQYFIAITYNDNYLIKTDFLTYDKRISLNMIPQKIIVDENIYLLLNDENYSIIKMFNRELIEIKNIIFERQIGSIYSFYNKIIFLGDKYNYILSKGLKLLSQKKSTGDFLCEYGDKPVFKNAVKGYDVINNIIYPL